MSEQAPPLAHGRFTWFEIPASSVPRAAAFYASVLGWSCPEADPAAGHGWPSCLPGVRSVHLISSARDPSLHGAFAFFSALDVAAATAAAEAVDRVTPADAGETGAGAESAVAVAVAVPRVVMTFNVDSIDETLERVVKHGGKVTFPKTEVGDNMGYFARFVDTEGNLVGISTRQ